jgi:hypothetical protein
MRGRCESAYLFAGPYAANSGGERPLSRAIGIEVALNADYRRPGRWLTGNGNVRITPRSVHQRYAEVGTVAIRWILVCWSQLCW